MNYVDFKEHPSEKLIPPSGRSKVYNWGLGISIVFSIIFFFGGLYLYSAFYPDREITLAVAFQIIFCVFLIFYVIYSIFALYHAFRFGFQGDLTTVSVIVFLIVSIILLVIAWNLVFGIGLP